MNASKIEKKAYVAPRLQELGEHSVIVATGGASFISIDGQYIQDGKAYATYES